MNQPRRRLLFFAEAISLAHIARSVTLAHSLDSARYEVHLVCDPRYLSLFDAVGFPVHTIRSVRSETLYGRLAQGSPLYTAMELHRYVREDLRIMAKLQPDLVIGDFRLSLSVSARLSAIPYASVTNAYWSPYARPKYIVPEVAIVRRFGPRVGQRIFSLLRPWVFAQQAYALNKIRRDYGMPAVGHTLNRMFSEADVTLYPDLPQLVPTINPPSHHRYIGPVIWSFNKLPCWWTSLRHNIPTAYVTMGTSGSLRIARMVAQSLASDGWQVLMATADGGTMTGWMDGIWVDNYLPGLMVAERADLVVCNGGSGAVYQALAAGTPILGIPMNLDQYLMMGYLRRSAAGDYLRAGLATAESVMHMARRIIETGSCKSRAVQLKEQMLRYRTGERFQTCLDHILQTDQVAPFNPHPARSAGAESSAGLLSTPAPDRCSASSVSTW
ncbi:MAG TPA: glycosyltransferase [Nitrospiraceae bacterium]|nr:glycosyltransferase [Nitrospiraceae bacterium]